MGKLDDILWLREKDNFVINCPKCESISLHNRPGVEPGFSYLENVSGLKVECPMCDTTLKVRDDWMYSFVTN